MEFSIASEICTDPASFVCTLFVNNIEVSEKERKMVQSLMALFPYKRRLKLANMFRNVIKRIGSSLQQNG